MDSKRIFSGSLCRWCAEKTYYDTKFDVEELWISRIEFYETENGASPVRQFLNELKVSDPDDFAAVLAGLAKLRNRQYHREPLSKAPGDGLFELRHVGKLNIRVFWFFVRGRRIVAVHGVRNKGQAIPTRDLVIARERMHDWQKREQP